MVLTVDAKETAQQPQLNCKEQNPQETMPVQTLGIAPRYHATANGVYLICTVQRTDASNDAAAQSTLSGALPLNIDASSSPKMHTVKEGRDERGASQISVKPTTENSPLAMAGSPALQASTMTVTISMITNMKPAMDRYSSCMPPAQNQRKDMYRHSNMEGDSDIAATHEAVRGGGWRCHSRIWHVQEIQQASML